MGAEVKVVDPSKYGLQEKEANKLTKDLSTIILERDLLAKQYGEIIQKELSNEVLEEARDIRMKLVKVRTQGINKWHKANKAYFKAGGDYVDAIKRKELVPVESMEITLKEIEDYYENQEKERVLKIKEEREAAVAPYIEEGDLDGMNLGEMSEDIWDSVFQARVASFNKKAEALKREEDEQKEREIKLKLHNERKDSLIPFWNFLDDIPEDLSTMTEKSFKALLKEGNDLKVKDDAEKDRLNLLAQNLRVRNDKMRELWSFVEEKSVEDLSDADFDKLVKKALKAKADFDEATKKAAEEKKVADEKAAKEALAAQKVLDAEKEKQRLIEASSDKVKVATYVKSLLELEAPKVTDEIAVKTLKGILISLDKIEVWTKEKLK